MRGPADIVRSLPVSAWLMNNIWWFAAGLVTLIVGLKIAILVAFRRLSQTDGEEGG